VQAEIAERRVKALQKEFLAKVEAHSVFYTLSPGAFNGLRKFVFRGTFEAYRLGVVGLATADRSSNLWPYFFGWLETAEAADSLSDQEFDELTEMCFRTALEAYRLGAMVASERDGADC
jgi:hypothetical protein